MCFALLAAAAVSTAAPARHAEKSADQATQIAELNHVYAVVDEQTAQAISQSEFLRRFANFEVRTTTGTRATWTGRYLRGRTTYLEFFAPKDFDVGGKPAAVGSWGIAISGDRQGDLHKLQERIEAAGHKVLVEPETRKFGDREVPWFNAATVSTVHGDSGDLSAPVQLWAMEYEPSYFAVPEAEKEEADGPNDVVSRERYQPDLYAQRMMRDVKKVELALTPGHFRRIEPMLVAAGFVLSRSGNRIEADGAGAGFRFWLTSPQYMAVREIVFSLNGPVEYRVEVIGGSTLVVGPGATAVWTFHPRGRTTADTR